MLLILNDPRTCLNVLSKAHILYDTYLHIHKDFNDLVWSSLQDRHDLGITHRYD